MHQELSELNHDELLSHEFPQNQLPPTEALSPTQEKAAKEFVAMTNVESTRSALLELLDQDPNQTQDTAIRTKLEPVLNILKDDPQLQEILRDVVTKDKKKDNESEYCPESNHPDAASSFYTSVFTDFLAKTEAVETSRDSINAKLLERQYMMAQYVLLDLRTRYFIQQNRALNESPTTPQNAEGDQSKEPSSILEYVTNQVRAVSDFAKTQLNPDFQMRPENSLGEHLAHVHLFAKKLFLISQHTNDTIQEKSTFPSLFTDTQAKVLAYVIAPLHDLFKYLGSKDAQVAQDHEILTAQFVRDLLIGQLVDLGGEEYVLTLDDVELIAAVIGDHENLGRESGRRDFFKSTDVAERMKAAFFLIDTLTGAFQFIDSVDAETGEVTRTFKVNDELIQKRFIDLFVRHYDLDRKAKTVRPEWAVETLLDYQAYLQVFESKGISFQEVGGVDGFIASLANKMIVEIDKTDMTTQQMNTNQDSIVDRLKAVKATLATLGK